MFNRLYILTFFISLTILWGGCNSSAKRKDIANSAPPKEIPEINDSDWNFELIHRVTSGEKQWRIRCKNETFCWAWTTHSILIGEGPNAWRDFYSVPRDSVTKTKIDSVFLESPSLGWMVQDSRLYKTEDGARSWVRVSLPGIENADYSVADIFFDKNHGQLVGGRFQPTAKGDPLINTEVREGKIRIAFILETVDGGVNWRFLQIPRLVGALTELNYWSNAMGIASSRTNLLMTTDNGTNWTDMEKFFPVVESERGSFVSGFFRDDHIGWLLFVGLDFETYFTDNKGKSWSKADWKIESNSNDTSSFPPAPRFGFVDTMRGLFVYDHSMGGELFKTSDGGRTWAQINLPNETFSDIVFTNNGLALVVGDSGVYRVTPK